ncbi:MAG TPA: thioesterase family protein [Egibacteraceae bacterium]|nr:thioesterase family protein [Egibacteraceae bacterium]
MDERFALRLSPRYMEVDQQGVVFNAWYLVWFDEAFTAWMRHVGVGYDELVGRGVDVQNVHAELDYRSGVRWGEEVGVEVDVVRVGGKSFTLGYTVRRGGEACVEGSIVYAVVATDGSGALEIPADLRAILEEHQRQAA